MSTRLCALLLVLAAQAGAQSPLDIDADKDKAPMPGLSDAGHGVPALIELRVEAIRQELASLKSAHAWAGEYSFGDGMGVNLQLHLAPKTGFAITWHGCMGLYGANEGQVRLTPDGVVDLDFRWQNLGEGFGQFPRQLLPFRWGERHYLVDTAHVARFINAIHDGREPRDEGMGMHFLRRGDEKIAVEGLPQLPPAWLAQIRTTPEVWTVREVRPVMVTDEAGKACVQQAEIDLVPADGFAGSLMPGIALRPEDSSPNIREVTALRSERGLLTASWSRLFRACDYDDQPPPIGMRLSTGAYQPRQRQPVPPAIAP